MFNCPGKCVVVIFIQQRRKTSREGKVTFARPPSHLEVGLEPKSVTSRQYVFYEVGLGGETVGGWQELPLPLCREVLSLPTARESPVGLSHCGVLALGYLVEVDK